MNDTPVIVEVFTHRRLAFGPFENSDDAVDWILSNVPASVAVNTVYLRDPSEDHSNLLSLDSFISKE